MLSMKKVRFLYPVWQFINRKNIKEFKRSPPILNYQQESIVSELKAKGIAESHILNFFPESEYLKDFQKFVQGKEGKSFSKRKPYLKLMWNSYSGAENPFMKFCSEKSITDVVNSYLGMSAIFKEASVIRNLPMNGEPTASQLWHRDPEDRKLVKIFLYLTDVDGAGGPFTYIQNSVRGDKWGKLFPQKPPRGSYPPKGEIEKLIPSQYIKQCLGPAGTLIFCDTSGFHKGGYATGKERIMFSATYITNYGRT